MRISSILAGPLMCFIVAMGMSFVMSFAMVAMNVGFTNFFISGWLRSWMIGFIIGFPTAAIMVPVARRIVERLTDVELK